MHILSKEQIDYIKSSALEAGEIAKDFFNSKNFSVKTKLDNTKVTDADFAVSKFLGERLSKNFPQIPITCEENQIRNFSEKTFWLIDPIDGTSSFINHNNEFSINIALIQQNKAVFGLIYSPLFENGKMAYSNHQNQVIISDDSKKEKILTAIKPDESRLNIITSIRTKPEAIELFIAQFYPEFLENYTIEKLSSSIKFFRLLENKANLYLHTRPSMEWDTAAGQALIEIMNGKVKNLLFNGGQFTIESELTYKKPDFLNNSFIAKF